MPGRRSGDHDGPIVGENANHPLSITDDLASRAGESDESLAGSRSRVRPVDNLHRLDHRAVAIDEMYRCSRANGTHAPSDRSVRAPSLMSPEACRRER